jgi:predicted lipoprotein with Yx(FWY)xxD motif
MEQSRQAQGDRITMDTKQVRKLAFGLALLLIVGLLGFSAVLAQDGGATVQLSSNDQLGSFLTDSKGMTLYIFTKDAPGVSNCYEDCAVKWPPLLAQEGQQPTLAAGIPGRLGVIARTDGGMQVTFNGMPLYYWQNDKAPGDTTGQGVGDVWFVTRPSDVSLGSNADLGSFLVGPNAMTLYMFTKDTPGTSNCYDDCAVKWPPLLVPDGQQPTVEPGLAGKVGTTERTDGTYQVTYNDMPLYYWQNDKAPGDATGQNVGEVWFVIQPPALGVGQNDALGKFLVGPDGMTLYMFKKDTPGTSNCYDDCAVKWPPLLVPDGMQPTAAEGIAGKLGTTERTDGTYQVTYNDMPLYYWFKDVVPGDATGQNVGEVWFVVAP